MRFQWSKIFNFSPSLPIVIIAVCSHMRPIMMMKLLSMLTVDLPALTENTVISLRMLTHHYERCSTYYSSGHPEHGMAGDEEKRLTMVLFTRLFDALAQRVSQHSTLFHQVTLYKFLLFYIFVANL